MAHKWIGFVLACITLSAATEIGTIPEPVIFMGLCVMIAGLMAGGKGD